MRKIKKRWKGRLMHALDPPPRTLGCFFGSLECRSSLRLSSPSCPRPASVWCTVQRFFHSGSDSDSSILLDRDVGLQVGDDDLQYHGPFGASVSRTCAHRVVARQLTHLPCTYPFPFRSIRIPHLRFTRVRGRRRWVSFASSRQSRHANSSPIFAPLSFGSPSVDLP